MYGLRFTISVLRIQRNISVCGEQPHFVPKPAIAVLNTTAALRLGN